MLLGIDNSNRGHVDNVGDIVAALQHMNRLLGAHQDRADLLGAAEFVQQFIGDVAGLQVGEDEDIGVALELGERILFFDQLRVEGNIGLDFTIDDQVGGLADALAHPGELQRGVRPAGAVNDRLHERMHRLILELVRADGLHRPGPAKPPGPEGDRAAPGPDRC